jgi:hypothetical protein
MAGPIGPRRIHHSRLAVVTLYVFVVAASAFFHHDFTCRQDSRTHCIACSVSHDAQRVEAHGGPLDTLQPMAGRVELRTHASVDIPSLSLVSDRAPPA